MPCRPGSFLLVGSKRSGTSLMVNLLNLHPKILVTHEADILWILYQLQRGDLASVEPHPRDDAKGLRATLELCAPVFEPIRSGTHDPGRLQEAYHRFFDHVNREGRGGWDGAAGKREIAWVGDKKPVQHTDPELRPFIERVLPDARYLHVVRDPRFVVASMMEAGRKWGTESVPSHWRGSAAEVYRRWARHEERAVSLGEEVSERYLRVRLEDLAGDPTATMKRIYGFLDLDLPEGQVRTLTEWVWRSPNTRHEPVEWPPGSRAARLARAYGYG